MKKIIIVSILVLALAGVGFYLYKAGHLSSYFQSFQEEEWRRLLVFEIKDKNLSPELAKAYTDKFNVVKASLEKNPDLFNYWLHLGVLKKAALDYEGARDVWVYAGKIRPKNSSSFANLADLYAGFLNEPQKAEEAIKTAIENDPNDFTFYLTLADIYRYKMPGKENLYEQTILDALKKFPDNPDLISALATYYRQTSQIEKAISFYEKLVILDPANQAAKDDLAELRAKANQ